MVKEAGCIVIRDGKVLVIRSNKKPHVWLFPKGHVEIAETAEQCAVREVEEETGVVCYINREVGNVLFSREGADYDVQYYLATYVGEIKPVESRKFFWCPLNDAYRILTFPNAKDLLTDVITGVAAV